MHNGSIEDFPKIKRKLQALLPDDIFNAVTGNTDSEHCFALFLSKLPNANATSFSHRELKQAMLDTIATLNKLAKDAGITQVHSSSVPFHLSP